MKQSNVVVVSLIVLLTGVTAWTAQNPTSDEVLRRVRKFALQARSGPADVSPTVMLSLVQDAVAADPDNSELYRALGDVELATLASPSQAGAMLDFAALGSTVQRVTTSYDKALQLNSRNAVALSGRGLMQVIGAFILQKPELTAQAVADLNAAVELDPAAVVPRLNRAFTGVNLLPPLRDNRKTEDDLQFLVTVSEGSRPGDMIHLLLGDLYAEQGRVEEARAQYQAAVRRQASAAKEQVAARLEALDKGSVPTAAIASMRGTLAFNCANCHAK